MNLGLGLGLSSGSASVSVSNVIDATGILLAKTYVRADTLTMYRDSSGVWQNAPANTLVEDHDYSGNRIGTYMWNVAITNKCTNYNWQPTDLTGLTAGGNASGAVTISTHPIHGFPTILIDNTLGGAGTKYANISGTFANTNPHSMRVEYYVETGANGSNAFINDSGGVGSVLGSTSVAVGQNGTIVSENFTPSNSARTMRINAGFNSKIHFWLNHLEETTVARPPIKVAGASASTTGAYCYVTTANIPNYNAAQGAIIAEVVVGQSAETANQYAFVLNNNASTAETIGNYFVSGSLGQARGRLAISSASKLNNDIHMPIRGKRFPVAISWRDSEAFASAGSMSYQINDTAFTGVPTGMNRLYIGGRTGSATEGFCGWIKSLTVVNRYRSLSQLAPYMFPITGTYKGIVSAGQSNAHGLHRSTQTKQNGGEIAAVSVMDSIWTTSENWLLDCGVDGSAADITNNASLYWLNAGADGNCMDRFKAITSAFGLTNCKAVLWDQGAADAADSYANFYANTDTIFTKFRSHIASVPVIIRPIAARADASYTNYNTVKRVHEALDAALSYVTLAPPQNKALFGSDDIHLTSANYGVQATKAIRKVLSVLGETVSGAVDPPQILTATRVGTALTIPVTFPSGITAITPTSSIYGLRYFDNGSEIALSSVAYAAGNITATLAGLPVGTAPQQQLYVGHGSLFDTDTATTIASLLNYPVGNDANTLGIQNTVITPS